MKRTRIGPGGCCCEAEIHDRQAAGVCSAWQPARSAQQCRPSHSLNVSLSAEAGQLGEAVRAEGSAESPSRHLQQQGIYSNSNARRPQDDHSPRASPSRHTPRVFYSDAAAAVCFGSSVPIFCAGIGAMTDVAESRRSGASARAGAHHHTAYMHRPVSCPPCTQAPAREAEIGDVGLVSGLLPPLLDAVPRQAELACGTLAQPHAETGAGCWKAARGPGCIMRSYPAIQPAAVSARQARAQLAAEAQLSAALAPCGDFLRRHPGISASHRAAVVDWLSELATACGWV